MLQCVVKNTWLWSPFLSAALGHLPAVRWEVLHYIGKEISDFSAWIHQDLNVNIDALKLEIPLYFEKVHISILCFKPLMVLQ